MPQFQTNLRNPKIYALLIFCVSCTMTALLHVVDIHCCGSLGHSYIKHSNSSCFVPPASPSTMKFFSLLTFGAKTFHLLVVMVVKNQVHVHVDLHKCDFWQHLKQKTHVPFPKEMVLCVLLLPYCPFILQHYFELFHHFIPKMQ